MKKEYLKINEEEELEFKDDEFGAEPEEGEEVLSEEDSEEGSADESAESPLAEETEAAEGTEAQIKNRVMSFDEYIKSDEYQSGKKDMLEDAPEVDLEDEVDEMPDESNTGAEEGGELPSDDIDPDNPEASEEEKEEGEI